jgi:pimeloyl-ACP methyl ester carboxylesterase
LAEPSADELLDPARGWLAALLFSPEFRRDQPERVHWLLEHFTRHRPTVHGVTANWWASFFHDTISRLHEIQSPTLVIHAERDAMSPPANAQLLAARIPDAKIAIVRGAGHGYALERPRESFGLLSDWIDRREPIAAGAARTGTLAAAEPFTRSLGLPIGMARTAASAAVLARESLALRRTR